MLYKLDYDKNCFGLRNIFSSFGITYDIYISKFYEVIKLKQSDSASAITSSIIRELLKYSSDKNFISLAGGIPANDLLDKKNLDRATHIALSKDESSIFQYSETIGSFSLREKIKCILQKRNMNFFDVKDIIVTTGSQQALNISTKAFLNINDSIFVIEPTYLAAIQSFSLNNFNSIGLPIENENIIIEKARELIKLHNIKALYCIPNFNNPSSKIMPKELREEIANLCIQYNLLLIEDDPYGEIWFEENPYKIDTISKMLSEKNYPDYIYISSFSKIVSPGLRIGWIACHESNTDTVLKVKQAFDLHSSSLDQAIISNYLELIDLDDVLNNLRKNYKLRMELLYNQINNSSILTEFLGEIEKPDGGLFIWINAGKTDFDQKLQTAIFNKIIYVPGSTFFINDMSSNKGKNCARLSLSSIDEDNSKEAILRLEKTFFSLN